MTEPFDPLQPGRSCATLPCMKPHASAMSELTGPDASSELWLSPRLVSAALVTGGFAAVAAGALGPAASQPTTFLYALVCYLAAAQVEVAWTRYPILARWSAVLWLSALAPVGVLLTDNPGLLLLLALPLLTGFALLGVRGGLAAALAMTLVLGGAYAAYARFGVPPLQIHLTAANTAAVFLAIWLAVGLLAAMYRPIQRMETWSHAYIARAQSLLDEARDRNATLDQALSDLIRVNRQLDLVNERLTAARTAAEEAQKAKTNFVAKVSHEFRTPLNMIIGLTDFVIQQADANATLPDDVRNDLHVIHRNSRHLATLINDVLDLSQVEAGQMVLHPHWVNLGVEIHDAVEVVLPLLQKKGLVVQVVVPGDLPQTYCDPIRIRQVLLNLISNAARHTAAGYVCIRAEASSGHVTVAIADSGPGIAQKELERIFEPFVRGTRSFTEPGEGSGLGLTVSKQLIEQHQGAVWVESELGQGSTFYFRLPLLPITEPLARAHRWISEEWTWKERTAPFEVSGRGFDWRVLLWDTTGCAHTLYDKFTTSDVELVRTQSLAETMQEIAQIPAHLLVINEAQPGDLFSSMAAAREMLPDTPILGCAIPPALETRRTPDVMDYLIKPVTRADLCAVLKAVPTPVRRVLVVDDDPDVRQLFVRMLRDVAATISPGTLAGGQPSSESLSIETAADCDEALALFEREKWDLILLDIVMPPKDGWSLLAAKQQMPHLAACPVVILSAQDLEASPDSSQILAATLAGGITGEFMVEMGFRLAAPLRARHASHDPGFRAGRGY